MDMLPTPPGPPPPPGWLHDPRDSDTQRYWDGASWTDQTRQANSFKRRFHFSPYWLLGLLVGLILLWGSGIFDKQLVGIGLNAHDCFEPADGSEIVCGSEAEERIEAQENPPFIPPPPTTPIPGDPLAPGGGTGIPTTPGIPGDPTAPGGVPGVP